MIILECVVVKFKSTRKFPTKGITFHNPLLRLIFRFHKIEIKQSDYLWREIMSSLTDTKTIRKRARKDLEEGAVTPDYKLDKNEVVKMLNGALATEIVCVLRYRFHYFMASGINKEGAAAEFIQHSNEEQGHADLIAERIAIQTYREMVDYFGEKDPTTRRLIETILAVEEEHADDIADLLFTTKNA